MTRKLKSRFGLIRDPFSKDVPVELLYAHDRAKSAITRLKAAVQARRCAVLTGEPGVGKTFVVRALEAELADNRFRVTYVHHARVNLRDFYRQLSLMLGLEPRATAAALFHAVRQNVEEIAAQRIHPVLVLDEAHLAPIPVLEHLHILLNFDRDSKPLLSLLLVGLPALRDLLARAALSSLAARLPVRAHLEALDTEQIGDYLRHRLESAGCAEQVFAEDAVLLIGEASGGVLRKIDVVAGAALDLVCEGRARLVDAAIVEDAIRLCAEALV
ncbi:MAG: AAA family ATPase [Pseudomonadales bacterium]|jgi:type II secretory pathway predicted ATPase ExeA|nr:AAA family ATPase [Pseudomonadales bacterium]